MGFEIRKYDANSPLPPEVGDQVIRIFRDNYPEFHSQANRDSDIAERADRTVLDGFLAEGRVIFTAHDIHEKVLGLLEMLEVDQGEGVYMQLVWIIVDALARGRGIASQLHEAFQAEAKERAGRIQKPSCLLLGVHPDNPAKKVYER